MLMTTLYNLELGQLPLSRVVPSPSSQQPLTQTHVYQKKKKKHRVGRWRELCMQELYSRTTLVKDCREVPSHTKHKPQMIGL